MSLNLIFPLNSYTSHYGVFMYVWDLLEYVVFIHLNCIKFCNIYSLELQKVFVTSTWRQLILLT